MELSQFLQTTKALYGQYYFFAEDQYQNHDLQAHIKILHNSCLNPDKKTTLTKQVMTISRTPSVVNIQINHQTQIRYGNLNILAHPHIRGKTSIGIDQNSRRSPRWWIEGTTDILQLHNTTTTHKQHKAPYPEAQSSVKTTTLQGKSIIEQQKKKERIVKDHT